MPNREFNLHISKLYSSLLILTVVGGLIILASMPWALWVKLVCMAALTFYTVHLLYRFVFLLSPHSILRLDIKDDHFILYTKENVYIGKLRGDSTITTVAMILRFDIENVRFPATCTVFYDALPKASFQDLLRHIKALN